MPGYVYAPCWLVWFSDSFAGIVGRLPDSVVRAAEPEISRRDNLQTRVLQFTSPGAEISPRQANRHG